MRTCLDTGPELIRPWLPPRPADCHKGDFGSVGILGGAPGMAGAAMLAARAALRLGAGRVFAGLLDERLAVDCAGPEVMFCGPDRCLAIEAPGCLVAGPGLGGGGTARQWLAAALDRDLPLLLDADGLNLLAGDAQIRKALKARRQPSVLTPHPGEAARLLGTDSARVQADRRGSIAALVEELGCVVALKGAGTLIASPDGRLWRNGTGNPGMASPGMGDVLSGMIGALLAQGLGAEEAAIAGVWLHGAAADALVAAGTGPVGLTAGELPDAARRLLNQLLAN